MLTLITGQPGNGKTLYTLGLVQKFREDEAKLGRVRPVYSSGIPELAPHLGWQELADPKTWPELPDGSIVVIDECQRIFPPRKQGAEVPPWVREFETHRHRGFDVFLITQHPQLLDIAVRKLTGRHYHLRRTFGREVSTVYQWEECVDPNERGKRNQALTSSFAFPKERFSWYKSATIHTVQKKLPWKPILVLAGSVVGVVVLGWWAFDTLSGIGDVPGQDTASAAGEVLNLEGEPQAVTWEPESLAPRVPHWPWSAPFYDSVAELRSAPRITGCMAHRIGSSFVCRCHNGQGDANVSQQVCRDFMAGRVFDPLREYSDAKRENVARLDAASAPAGQAMATGSPSDPVGSAPRS